VYAAGVTSSFGRLLLSGQCAALDLGCVYAQGGTVTGCTLDLSPLNRGLFGCFILIVACIGGLYAFSVVAPGIHPSFRHDVWPVFPERRSCLVCNRSC
jgi:hypothetical protein